MRSRRLAVLSSGSSGTVEGLLAARVETIGLLKLIKVALRNLLALDVGVASAAGCLHKIKGRLPHGVDDFSVVQTVEDAIAANQNEVEVRLDLEAANLRLADDHVRVSSEALSLRFDVTEGPSYRESSREDPKRTLYVDIFLVRVQRGSSEGLRSIDLATG
jgi:hypothetical protein